MKPSPEHPWRKGFKDMKKYKTKTKNIQHFRQRDNENQTKYLNYFKTLNK